MTSTGTLLLISNIYKFVLLITFFASMIGCGLPQIAYRSTNPVIQDIATPPWFSGRSIDIIATTASRRLAILYQNQYSKSFVTCAEPPPDVGEVFAEAITTGLKASATVTPQAGGSGSGELAAQFGRAVATQIAPLLYRTQGLQLYRDATYKLCIDKMNGWIQSLEEYEYERRQKFELALELIKQELPVMEKMIEAFYSNVKAGNAQVNVNDNVKTLDAQKK
jgi:hypothetical protein